MAKPYKDTPKRSVGRPRNDEITERQALIQREIIKTLKPLYKPAAEVLAELAGIKLDKPKEELVIEDDNNKKETVSANVRCTAAKTIMDKFEEAIYNQFAKEDTTPAKKVEPEAPSLAPVRQLSLTVKQKDE